MDADAEFDASILWHTAVALDEAGLHLDGAAHRIDHARNSTIEPSPARLTMRPRWAAEPPLCAWPRLHAAVGYSRPPNVKRDHHEQGAEIAL